MKIRLTVSLDLDLNEYRAVYGDDTMTADDIRENLRNDIINAFTVAHYNDAVKEINVK